MYACVYVREGRREGGREGECVCVCVCVNACVRERERGGLYVCMCARAPVYINRSLPCCVPRPCPSVPPTTYRASAPRRPTRGGGGQIPSAQRSDVPTR